MTKRALAFAFILSALPFAENAATKNSAHVVLDNPVTVGTTEVPKGNYKVEWTGTDANAEVTFTSGKWSKTIPAHIVEEKNSVEAQTTTLKGDKTILTGLELHNATLVFTDGTRTGE
jgi:hypothetical protein